MSFGLNRETSNNLNDSNIPPPGSNIDCDEIDSSTPWMAASDGNLSLLQASLNHLNLPVTVLDENGYSLLHAAASYSQLEVIDWLLMQAQGEAEAQQKQNPLTTLTDVEGDTALHYASTVEAVKKLLAAGVDIHHKNQAGMTALQHKQEELENLLQDEDVDDEDDEVGILRILIDYLSSLSLISQ